MEGDTTGFYLFRRLQDFDNVKVSILARGVAIGNELEFTDELTLGRSIINRIPFSDTFSKK
jgi:recombination protein RecR